MDSTQKERHAPIKPIQRRATQGPLGAPEPDSLARSETENGGDSSESDPAVAVSAPAPPQKTFSLVQRSSTPSHIPKKKFAYLLRPEIYHPLTVLNVPPALREEFFTVSARDTLEALLTRLEDSLSKGRLLRAAYLAASILTSPVVKPTDYTTIFSLFYIRLACLELTGNLKFASQESKALEDLISDFYYIDAPDELRDKTDTDADESNVNKYKDHIAPWELRVLAVRLQSIGFSDARRGIAGHYDLAFYARNQLSYRKLSKEDVELWKSRLEDIGIRVVNSLAEMGDMETARRLLASLDTPRPSGTTIVRLALLNLHIGDVTTAQTLLDDLQQDDSKEVIKCLLLMAEGRYIESVSAWEAALASHIGKDNEALIRQNLAVCLLFTGRLNESRELMESLVEQGNSFQSLIFNLATIYELCSERLSLALKTALTEDIARHLPNGDTNVERSKIDFKI